VVENVVYTPFYILPGYCGYSLHRLSSFPINFDLLPSLMLFFSYLLHICTSLLTFISSANMRVLASSTAIIGVIAALATEASAQGFWDTCVRNFRVKGTYLYALCGDDNGGFKCTRLDLNHRLANVRGEPEWRKELVLFLLSRFSYFLVFLF
jgi:hypothetical protein